MEITNLEVFLLVAKEKSLSKAAKLLHLTQPAVSNKIHMLETILDLSLFDRSPSGVTLTSSGQTFYQYANEITMMYNEMVEALKGTITDQKMIIGAEAIIGNYFIPCRLAAFKEKFPNIDIKIISGDQADLLEKLERNELDFAFVDGTIPLAPNFHTKLLSTEPLYLAVPNSEKWKNIDSITTNELYSLPFILPDEKTGLHQSIKQSLNRYGISKNDLHISAEVSSISAIKTFVESGFGVSFLCGLATKKEIHSKSIKLIKVDSLSLNLNYYVAYHPEKLHDIHKQFINQFVK